MAIFGKSAKVISARRETKRAVVEMIMTCVEHAPHGLMQNAILDSHEIGEVTHIVSEFVTTLEPEDVVTLKTAKGCTSRPATTIERHSHTLYEFLKLRTTGRIQDAGCMHGFVFDLSKWAEHIWSLNPKSEIPWGDCQRRLKEALEGVQISRKQYFANPAIRLPRNLEETLWYLVQAACELEDDPNGLLLWTARRAVVDQTLRTNPTVEALTWDKAVGLGNKWYINGDIPEDLK